MVLHLLPVAFAGATGVAGWLAGRSKKEVSIEEHAEYEHYQPTITEAEKFQHFHPRMIHAPQTAYAYTGGDIFIESPGATSKKETTIGQESKPEISGAIDYATDTVGATREGEGDIAGVNMTHIALIAAAGLIGYGLLQPKKGRGKK